MHKKCVRAFCPLENAASWNRSSPKAGCGTQLPGPLCSRPLAVPVALRGPTTHQRRLDSERLQSIGSVARSSHGASMASSVRRPVPRRPATARWRPGCPPHRLACGSPPAVRLPLDTPAPPDRRVELGHVETVSHENHAFGRSKNELSPGWSRLVRSRLKGQRRVRFGRWMMSFHSLPTSDDPLRPVVCMEGEDQQALIARHGPRWMRQPCQPRRVDYEYERKGVADLFIFFEPLRCGGACGSRRRVARSSGRGASRLLDEHYPERSVWPGLRQPNTPRVGTLRGISHEKRGKRQSIKRNG